MVHSFIFFPSLSLFSDLATAVENSGSEIHSSWPNATANFFQIVSPDAAIFIKPSLVLNTPVGIDVG